MCQPDKNDSSQGADRQYRPLDLELYLGVPERGYLDESAEIKRRVQGLTEMSAESGIELLWELYEEFSSLGVYIGMIQICKEVGYFATPDSLEFSKEELPELPSRLLKNLGYKLCDAEDLRLLLGRKMVSGPHFANPDYIQRNMYANVQGINWTDNTARVALSRDRTGLDTSDMMELSIVGFCAYKRGRLMGQELLLDHELAYHRHHSIKEPKLRQPIALDRSRFLTTGRLAGDNLTEECFYESVGDEMQAIFGYTELATLRSRLDAT